MRVSWHCSMTVGITSSAYGDYENECDCDFETDVDEEDWQDNYASAICPKCGGELLQDYDEPQIVICSTKYAPDVASATSAEPDSGLESVPAVEFDTQPRG